MNEQSDDWRGLEEPWQRLRWARQDWQRDHSAVAGTAEHAAESLGMKPGTYRAYERPPGSSKHIALDHQAAIRFGRKFRVSWTWLLTGAGTPSDEDLSEPQARVVQAMAEMDEERQEALATMAEVLARATRTGTDG